MHIIHLVSNPIWGGGEQYVLDLAKAMKAEGHKVEIITRGISSVVDRFTASGLTPVAKLPLRGAIDFISPVRLASRLRQTDDVIIHVHNFKDAIVAARARTLSGNDRVRIVLTRHLIKEGRVSSLYRDLYSRIDAMVFVSQLSRDIFLSTNPPVDMNKIHVVHNSIASPRNEDSYSEVPADNTPIIMYHGRIAPEKGLDILIDALGRITDIPWRLQIAGEGKAQHVGPLKQQCSRLGIADRVDWLGFRNDVHAVIPTATIGVIPSTVRESFGLSVLDYMAHGIPVVTTNNGAQPEYITDGINGMLVPPSDPNALVEAIRRLLTDSTLRDKIGRAGATSFETTLSYSHFLDKIKAIYQSVRR